MYFTRARCSVSESHAQNQSSGYTFIIVSDSPTVNAIVPLALLEAIRNLDTPLDDGLAAELASDAIAKRLGLSDTVAAQIERYKEMVDRRDPVSAEEATQVFRLVGRRADATLVYADAGRRAARYGARSNGSRPLGALGRVLPDQMQRNLGVKRARKVANQVFLVDLVDDPKGTLGVRLTDTLATRSGVEGNGCHFYTSLLAELLRVTSGFEGSMVHERCLGRGDDACRWRAAEPEA
jgi:hypothetical protein